MRTPLIKQLGHTELAHMREQHPDWVWHRSDTHVFLAPPGSHESFKTVVEPGNSFSPGPLTYGVATWVFTEGVLHAPEEKPLDALTWRFLDGYLPVLISNWEAGALHVTSRLFTDGDVTRKDLKTYLAVEVTNPTDAPVAGTVYLVLRSFGAAGGPLRSLAQHEAVTLVNGAPLIYANEVPTTFGALSYTDTQSDISTWLRQGHLPGSQSVEDASTWASGALAYPVILAPGEHRQFSFAFHLQAGHWMLPQLEPPQLPFDYEAREAAFAAAWRASYIPHIEVPDARFREAFYAQLTHLLMFMSGDAPRISPITYPLWWLRDCSYITLALDRGGFHEVAERACRDAVRHDVYTGFGTEADSPGQVIWMLAEHHHLLATTSPKAAKTFLRETYPFIQQKAELIIQMRHTTTPITIPHEFCTHEQMLTPTTDLLCQPARDGLIVGRMDLHFPIFWTSGFSYLGLIKAADCAEALGKAADAKRFRTEAEALQTALRAHATTDFGKNERDPVSALWPTEWAIPTDALIRERYDTWWHTKRFPDGMHKPEQLWTYFEVGEAHNQVILGERERAWVSLNYFLDTHTAPGLYTYPEGERDENSASLLWERTRGWDVMRYVTPNGWTAAELFLLLRDCLVREDGDRLILGQGVPTDWLASSMRVHALPTRFGPVTWCYDPAGHRLEVRLASTPPGGIVAAFPMPVDLHVMTPLG